MYAEKYGFSSNFQAYDKNGKTVSTGSSGSHASELGKNSLISRRNCLADTNYVTTTSPSHFPSPMNRTICSFKRVASWTVCTLTLGLSVQSFGQQSLPVLMPINVPNFTIPFEVGESATGVREVELLVSKDRGRRWHFVDRQSVESGKFAFRADAGGEYWFAFRTVTANGNVDSFNGQPQLRVQVNTNEPMVVLPSQRSESGPLLPPKPERYRTGNEPKLPSPLTALAETKESETDAPESKPERVHSEESVQFLAPKLPGFVPPDRETNPTGSLLDDLLSGMSPFMDVQPAIVGRIPSDSRALPALPHTSTPRVPTSFADSPVGGITGVDLNPVAAGQQIIVRWNAGDGLWQDAQIDVLRGGSKEGPWFPIAINLPNSGEYWWFITPEDLKPFYIAVRIRSAQGGIREDVTYEIDLKSKLALQHQRP